LASNGVNVTRETARGGKNPVEGETRDGEKENDLENQELEWWLLLVSFNVMLGAM
jgi:hypothetical protein